MTTTAPIILSNAVNQITAASAPILILDTCSVLDLIRLPRRAKDATYAQAELAAVKNLKDSAQARKLWIVVPPIVYDEWSDNYQTEVRELSKFLSKLDNSVAITNKIDDFLSSKSTIMGQYAYLNLEAKLKSFSEEIFSGAIFLEEDIDCKDKALSRAVSNTPPASRGGGIKDCIIIEHAIKLCNDMRTLGHKESVVFNTSNTRDYCEIGTGNVKEPLKAQFQGIKLTLTTSWQWTKTELGI